MRLKLAVALLLAGASTLPAQARPRGRDLGIPFPGQTGPLNAITDVAGIAVGHVTLIEGEIFAMACLKTKASPGLSSINNISISCL